MDFVVVGFGLGALSVLLGFALRDLGPRRRAIPPDATLPVAEVTRRVAWGRACRAGGGILALAGTLVWLVTFAALVGQAGDELGDLLVLTSCVVALALIAGWFFAYRRLAQHPFSWFLTRRRSRSAGRARRGAHHRARHRRPSAAHAGGNGWAESAFAAAPEADPIADPGAEAMPDEPADFGEAEASPPTDDAGALLRPALPEASIKASDGQTAAAAGDDEDTPTLPPLPPDMRDPEDDVAVSASVAPVAHAARRSGWRSPR